MCVACYGAHNPAVRQPPFGKRRSARNSKLFTLNSSGFTLIELLIVTVVIVTLMGIVFRLAGVGGDSRAKSKTQARLQRLENAISGYYAAYGSYPPVPLVRSRDINRDITKSGFEKDNQQKVNLSNPSDKDRQQVESACRAQPIGVLYPFCMYEGASERKVKAEKLVKAIAKENEWTGDYTINNVKGTVDDGARLFQFGLLSFLMPRYLFMLEGDSYMYDVQNGQWARNNQLPCRIDTGQTYDTWESIQEFLYKYRGKEASMISNLTSQVVCARWMPNFEGIVSGGLNFYGVDTSDNEWPYLSSGLLRIFYRNNDNGSESDPYLLNGMTVADGWRREFYYYIDPPYQSYRLWSAGANGQTFPPWLNIDGFSQREQVTITKWTADDVCHLAN